MDEPCFLIFPKTSTDGPSENPTLFMLPCTADGHVRQSTHSFEKPEIFFSDDVRLEQLTGLFSNLWGRDEELINAVISRSENDLPGRLGRDRDNSNSLRTADIRMKKDDLIAFKKLIKKRVRMGHPILIGEPRNTVAEQSRVEAEAFEEIKTVCIQTRHCYSQYQTIEDLQTRFRNQVVAFALSKARVFDFDLPPLKADKDWRSSEIHSTARALVAELGARAFDEGWPLIVLRERIKLAVEFLLRARGGGLGQVVDAYDEEKAAASKLTVLDKLPADLIGKGVNPITDPRTKNAYCVTFPKGAISIIYNDDFAKSRLREVPSLINEYLSYSWFRYGPISASLARGIMALEYAQFSEVVFSTPVGILDGSLSFESQSWSYRWSNEARRSWIFALLRMLPRIAGRIVTTLIVLAALNWLEVRQAGWIAFAWLLFGTRIREFALGKSSESASEKQFKLLEEMKVAWSAIAGRAIPVASFRHALVTSTHAGAVWDESAWRLLADAERRHEAVWHVSIG